MQEVDKSLKIILRKKKYHTEKVQTAFTWFKSLFEVAELYKSRANEV